MKYLLTITAAFLLLLQVTPPLFAQGAGNEWDILNQTAGELYRRGKYDRAVVVAKKALKVAKENVGPNHPIVAQSVNNLAELYYAQGQYAEIEALLKPALAETSEPKNVSDYSYRLALAYFAQRRYTEAESLIERVLMMLEEIRGPDHLEVATLLNYLATSYFAQERYAEAEPLFERALMILEVIHGADHPEVATNLEYLAALYQATKRDEEAETLAQRAARIRAIQR